LAPSSPNIKRIPIPRELLPDLPPPDKKPENAEPKFQTQDRPRQPFGAESSAGQPLNLAGGSAVSVQVAESAQPQPKAALPSANLSIEQAVQQARDASQNEKALGLTEDEEKYVEELKAIDREVRQHEAAHASTGGAFAGQPSYEYVTGPDGIRYAVAGKVSIDVAPIAGDPEATIRKLETVKRAALAPGQPSGQDRAVAAQAEAGLSEARAEKIAESKQDPISEAADNSKQTGLKQNGLEQTGPEKSGIEDDGEVSLSGVSSSIETESDDAFGNTGGLVSQQPSLVQAFGGAQSQPILDLFA
jgi:hypothetical protein